MRGANEPCPDPSPRTRRDRARLPGDGGHRRRAGGRQRPGADPEPAGAAERDRGQAVNRREARGRADHRDLSCLRADRHPADAGRRPAQQGGHPPGRAGAEAGRAGGGADAAGGASGPAQPRDRDPRGAPGRDLQVRRARPAQRRARVRRVRRPARAHGVPAAPRGPGLLDRGPRARSARRDAGDGRRP